MRAEMSLSASDQGYDSGVQRLLLAEESCLRTGDGQGLMALATQSRRVRSGLGTAIARVDKGGYRQI